MSNRSETRVNDPLNRE